MHVYLQLARYIPFVMPNFASLKIAIRLYVSTSTIHMILYIKVATYYVRVRRRMSYRSLIMRCNIYSPVLLWLGFVPVAIGAAWWLGFAVAGEGAAAVGQWSGWVGAGRPYPLALKRTGPGEADRRRVAARWAWGGHHA